MKRLSTIGLIACIALSGFGQTLAKWTFETSVPAGSPGAGSWITNIAAEIGSGTASGWHAGAATYSNPAGNGSAESFSSQTWAVGDLYQFVVSTVGYSGIGLSFDQTSSTSGPGFYDLSYSTDGISFTTFASYVVNSNALPNPLWNSSTASSLYTHSYDLSGVSALNNQATVYFRMVDNSTASAGGGAPSAAGSSRLDNVEIAVVPEPATTALVAMCGLIQVMIWRRRKVTAD